eukprot:9476786-Pyramimonas_sp.AAC.1
MGVSDASKVFWETFGAPSQRVLKKGGYVTARAVTVCVFKAPRAPMTIRGPSKPRFPAPSGAF